MVGTSGQVVAIYNMEVVSPTWQITSGGEHATISQQGIIDIVSSGDVIVKASYEGYDTTKTISLTYQTNTQSRTLVDEDGSVTTQISTTSYNQDGTTSTSIQSTIVHEDGSVSHA